MGAHAKLAPSASTRWMNCPGSIKLSESVPEPPSSSFAEEGTAAHALCEEMLTDIVFYKEGDKINGWVVDKEMIESAEMYTKYVEGISHSAIMVEQRFDLSWLYPGVFGSNDACVYDEKTKHLTIVDLKYGKGLKVDPDWNSQLMIYALGAVEHLWKLKAKESKKDLNVKDVIKTLTLSIVQPRILSDASDTGIRTWDIDVEDLFFWGLNVFRPAAKATENENAILAVGDHCRFCPALAICPEQARSALALAKTDFDNPVMPRPEDLTAQEIQKVMEVSSIISKWTKDIASYAHTCMENGMHFEGFKLVRRKSNRKWVNEYDTLETLSIILGEAAFDKKVLSVAKAEKVLKLRNISPEATLDGMWIKPDTGTTVAPISDKRREVAPQIDNAYEDNFLE